MNHHEIILGDIDRQRVHLVLRGIAAAESQSLVTVLSDGEAVLDRVLGLRHDAATAPERSADLIILGESLPKLSGVKLLKQLRWLHRNDAAVLPPIVMVSHSADDGDIGEAFRCGASGYLLSSDPASRFLTAVERTVRYWLDATLRPFEQKRGAAIACWQNRSASGRLAAAANR